MIEKRKAKSEKQTNFWKTKSEKRKACLLLKDEKQKAKSEKQTNFWKTKSEKQKAN